MNNNEVNALLTLLQKRKRNLQSRRCFDFPNCIARAKRYFKAKRHRYPLSRFHPRLSNTATPRQVQVGAAHQAQVPDYEPPCQTPLDYHADAPLETLLWRPNDAADTAQLDEFLCMATHILRYSLEQAITVFHASGHSCDSAVGQLRHYTNSYTLLSRKEQQQFELLLACQGARFNRIKQGMPSRRLGELLDFYLRWVPRQTELSLLDHLAELLMLVPLKVRMEHVFEEQLEQIYEAEGLLSNEQLLRLALCNATSLQSVNMTHELTVMKAQIHRHNQLLRSMSDVMWLSDWDELRYLLLLHQASNTDEWEPLDKELLLFALQEHGANFALIARILGNKTKQQVSAYLEYNKELLQGNVAMGQGAEQSCSEGSEYESLGEWNELCLNDKLVE